MKRFVCADVVPGCGASVTAATDDEVRAWAGAHGARDHGLVELTPALVAQVRAAIRAVD